ncbi:MAG TPA: adenosylcobinamide-phosphate synthase CbiB [Acidimicrobiia bacterium]|nr:adenosylcobinamide-phosphate synthase CbiB [Acidimicrobiia bacterium]
MTAAFSPRRPLPLAKNAVAVAGGLLADRALGEPPSAVHPVAAFGRALGGLERRVWRDSQAAGAIYTGAGVGLGWAAGFALGPSVPAGVVATWLVVAGRALGNEARAIGERLIDDDLDGARLRLPALVGRDPEALDAKGVARAVVESVAENTVDAVVAPACWATVGGPAGAGFYRAVNTLDAMVGHRNDRYRRFGWAAARLDDAANWIPARLTALLVAAVRPARAREVLDAIVHPPAHPSPNAGVAEAAFAAALGLRLGGDTVYAGQVDPRPTFGTGRPPEPTDIDAAIRLSRDVTLALAALLATPTVLSVVARHLATPQTGVRSPGYGGKGTPVGLSAPGRGNRRSFTGIRRKRNAGWEGQSA